MFSFLALSFRLILFLGFLALSLLLPVSLAQAASAGMPDLLQAEQLIRSGKANEAWRLLSPHEFAFAGNEDYDYLLGVAALDSGRADRATLVFERVLAVNPDHAAARLDMARAYFALGDYQRARGEFDQVQRHEGTPPAAQQTIARYLAAIEERAPGRNTWVTGYAEAGIGRDSNLNSAASSGSIYVPLFRTSFTLGPNSVKAADKFLAVGGGAELAHAIGSGVSLFAGIDVKQRMHRSWDSFDNRSVDFRVGFQAIHDRDTVRLTVGRSDYDLDNAPYRRIGSLGLDLRHAADARTQLLGFAQVSEIKYLQDGTQSYSSNQTIAGFGLVRGLEGGGNPAVFGSVFAGDDTETNRRADGDRELFGARIGYQRQLRDNLDVFTTLSFQYSGYNRFNPLFQKYRKENQYDWGIGLNWRFQSDWSLKPQLTYMRTDSNLGIYDYNRYELSLTARKDFRLLHGVVKGRA